MVTNGVGAGQARGSLMVMEAFLTTEREYLRKIKKMFEEGERRIVISAQA